MGLFCIRHTSQFHEPELAANLLNGFLVFGVETFFDCSVDAGGGLTLVVELMLPPLTS